MDTRQQSALARHPLASSQQAAERTTRAKTQPGVQENVQAEQPEQNASKAWLSPQDVHNTPCGQVWIGERDGAPWVVIPTPHGTLSHDQSRPWLTLEGVPVTKGQAQQARRAVQWATRSHRARQRLHGAGAGPDLNLIRAAMQGSWELIALLQTSQEITFPGHEFRVISSAKRHEEDFVSRAWPEIKFTTLKRTFGSLPKRPGRRAATQWLCGGLSGAATAALDTAATEVRGLASLVGVMKRSGVDPHTVRQTLSSLIPALGYHSQRLEREIARESYNYIGTDEQWIAQMVAPELPTWELEGRHLRHRTYTESIAMMPPGPQREKFKTLLNLVRPRELPTLLARPATHRDLITCMNDLIRVAEQIDRQSRVAGTPPELREILDGEGRLIGRTSLDRIEGALAQLLARQNEAMNGWDERPLLTPHWDEGWIFKPGSGTRPARCLPFEGQVRDARGQWWTLQILSVHGQAHRLGSLHSNCFGTRAGGPNLLMTVSSGALAYGLEVGRSGRIVELSGAGNADAPGTVRAAVERLLAAWRAAPLGPQALDDLTFDVPQLLAELQPPTEVTHTERWTRDARIGKFMARARQNETDLLRRSLKVAQLMGEEFGFISLMGSPTNTRLAIPGAQGSAVLEIPTWNRISRIPGLSNRLWSSPHKLSLQEAGGQTSKGRVHGRRAVVQQWHTNSRDGVLMLEAHASILERTPQGLTWQTVGGGQFRRSTTELTESSDPADGTELAILVTYDAAQQQQVAQWLGLEGLTGKKRAPQQPAAPNEFSADLGDLPF